MVVDSEHFIEHSRKSLDALHACMSEWLRVAVERPHALRNRALKPFVNSVGDQAQEVDVHLLLRDATWCGDVM